MTSYVLRAENPSKLAEGKYVYYTEEGSWDNNIHKAVYYLKKDVASKALATASNPVFKAEIYEVTDGPNPNARDGDGDGLVEDSTEFERPVEATSVTRKPTVRRRRKTT